MLEKSICPMPVVALEKFVPGSSVAAATAGCVGVDAGGVADDTFRASSDSCPIAV